MKGCFIEATLGPSAGPCDGPLQRAHLIPKQVIKRELGLRGKIKHKGKRGGGGKNFRIVWDRRVWRWACEKHHHALDYSKKVRLRREHIPAETEEYAAEHGLTWRLDRDFGLREAAA